MKCPRCSGNGYSEDVRVTAGSALGGEVGEIAYSGSCILCGHYKAIHHAPKDLNIKEQCCSAARVEPNQAARMRCTDYFERFKSDFKDGLVAGRTFKAIWLELKENNIELPSRSWLRKEYLLWAKNGFAPVHFEEVGNGK